MKINLERVKRDILKIGSIGKNGEDGVTRLAFSQEYRQAAASLKKLMQEAKLKVSEDKVGNLSGLRKAKNNNQSHISFGSHLDTVKNGGLFDGTLGVIAALECMRTLDENNYLTNHPLEMFAFNAEEGSEVGGTFGSRVMTGLVDLESKSLLEGLPIYDLEIEDLKNSIRNLDQINSFLELHIEQGPFLDSNSIPIGIVDGIAGITRYQITAKGDTNHAGTTSMKLRKDAMTGAAKLIAGIEEIAQGFGEGFVATIGKLKIYPGAVNVIPGKVDFVLELRDLDQKRIDSAVNQIKEKAETIEKINFDFKERVKKTPVQLDKNIMEILKENSDKLKLESAVMASGAGHDAKAFAKKIPTGMIFVPSKNGKSHCPEESTNWNDIEKGVQLLLNTIIDLDKKIDNF